MNRTGHAQTLVPAHPGNQNAVKAGVFSPRIIGSRVEEAEQAIAGRDPDEVIDELLRTEVARLLVMRDAMDQALEEDGVRGRGGQPRTMVDLRLRLNTRLLKTVDELQAQRDTRPLAAVAAELEAGDDRSAKVLDVIAREHACASIDLVTPEEFDPAAFLAAIVTSDDPKVDVDDQLRARELLKDWRRRQPDFCVCFTTRSARDAAEFRAWMDELREVGHTAREGDDELAPRICAVARGEYDEAPVMWAKTTAAIEIVINRRLRASKPGDDANRRVQGKVLNARLWRSLLSPDREAPIRLRLKAFRSLERADAFRECTCGGGGPMLHLAEGRRDAFYAYLVKLLTGRHYRAAAAAVLLPETYLAVNDVIDAKVRAQSG